MKAKLQLNKKTVSELSNSEMESVKGGFTYSLSLGKQCKYSKSLGANVNAYQCGAAHELKMQREAEEASA